jgi:glycosyltransferase involved in cell wall biosynthesis
MRILISTPLYPPDLGRASTIVKTLATQLSTRHTMSVLTYGAFPEETANVRVACVTKEIAVPLRMVAFTLRAFRELRGVDVVVLTDGASVGVPTVLAAWLRRVPVVRLMVEDEYWEREVQSTQTLVGEEEHAYRRASSWRLGIVRALQGWVLRHSVRVLVPSSVLKRVCEQAYGIAASRVKVEVIPPGRMQTVPFEILPTPNQILITAPLISEESIRCLLGALSSIVTEFPAARLVVAYDGAEALLLKRIATEMHVESHVVMLGLVSEVEAWTLRQSSTVVVAFDAAVHRAEDIASAFVAGTPVVAVDVAAHRDVVDDGVSGVLVPASDVEALADALKRVLRDSLLRVRLVDGGRAVLKRRVNWEAYSGELVRACEEVTA